MEIWRLLILHWINSEGKGYCTRSLERTSQDGPGYKMKIYADMKRRTVEFQVGDMVFLKIRPYRPTSLRKKRNDKLSPKYFGSYKIL